MTSSAYISVINTPASLYRFVTLFYVTLFFSELHAVTEIKVGVMLIADIRVPYSVHRVAPAVNIALEKVNNEILNSSYRVVSELRIYDDICDARFASGVAADLYHKEQVAALIGPACAYSLDGVGRMAGFWNIPIVTGLGDGGEFKNKTDFPTLTRFAYCQCRLRRVFGSVFRQFGWTDLVVIYDMDDIHSDVLGNTLKNGLRLGGYYPYVIQFYKSRADEMKQILLDASQRARVIVLIVPGDTLRAFMLAAHELGFPQSGEYVFMDVQLFDFPGQYWGDHHWRRGDENDKRAKEAYDAVLKISLYQSEGEEWQKFAHRVINTSAELYNFTFGREEVNFFVGAFYDAVVRYGLALNETLSLGEDVRDGRTLARRMWDLTLQGVTGDVIIDDNGDRDTNFAILDMNMTTGEFQIVANYWGANPGFTPVEGVSIHWPGPLGRAPPNVPHCGFNGKAPACQPSETIPTYQVAILSLLAVMVLGLVVAFFLYRKIAWERDLRSMSWRIQLSDIHFQAMRVGSLKVSRVELEDGDLQYEETRQCFTEVGVYQGMSVAVKRTDLDKLDLTRKVLLEIKTMRDLHHDNLTRFIGACVEPGQIFVVTEYCAKGSLQDVLLNDSIKLDWTFRTSLLKDIAKGMAFLHQTPVHHHGHLRSSNCVVDRRFNLKITDFGLPTFRPQQVVGGNDEDQHAKLEKLLWVAPEHLSKVQSAGYTVTGGSQKGDVYSFGIILEEVILRSLPFEVYRGLLDVTDILDRVIKHQSPPFRPKVRGGEAPETLMALMEQCWHDDPDCRPSFDHVLKAVKSVTSGKEANLVEALITRLEEYASNLENVVEERTKELIDEKKKSETLLYQILPRSVVEQLKKGQPVVPEAYDSVTIYFSDIVGFTAMSAASSPMQVVELLNDLYSEFDSVIDAHDVYKVETIGDAYMVASGLPEKNGDKHAAEICRLALALLQRTSVFKIRHRPKDRLQLRIGIHSGPCCAGVVGLKMPRYCLFGDTVNTASRMESTGEALKIHMSSSTKEILDRFGTFITQLRGDVEMKGKGVQTTYWLLGETTSPADVKLPGLIAS